ncbi:hypothetical protein HZ326_26595 [Fusarium oxysporum f. sp. albedinis]|nr:hypothetical protein HZ326_26595 [Fusarium oxysporum f. sp. albedinis]
MNVNQCQSPTPFPDDCLPPEGEYETREALFEAINAWAATRGYAFITGRSTKEKTGRRTITYMCDRRHNLPIVSRERQRKTTTRTTGCEFSVLAKENKDRSTWTLRHRSDSRFSLHNHEFTTPEEPRPPVMKALSEIQWQQITTLETFEFENESTCQDLSSQLTIETEQVDRHITTPEPRHPSPTPSTCRPQVSPQLNSRDLASNPTTHLRHDDPRAIHQRYVKSREDWYKVQPPGAWLGNRQYRKAMGLPLGYPKASYSWCLDYKQMGRCCKPRRVRENGLKKR